MKAPKIFLLLSFVICIFGFIGCNNAPVLTINFAEHDDIVLTFGVDGFDSAKFNLCGEDKNYTFDYDNKVITIDGNTIHAVGIGTTNIALKGANNVDYLKVVVKAGEFCGNVSIYPQYKFYLGQTPQPLEILGLNASYQYDIKYITQGDAFSIDNAGVINPQKLGSANLQIQLINGVDKNELNAITLDTTIIVEEVPSLKFSLLDYNKQPIANTNGNYSVYLAESFNNCTTAFYFALDNVDNLSNVRLTNQDLPITLSDCEIIDGVLYQKFFVDKKCNFTATYEYAVPAVTQTKYVSINVYAYMSITDISVLVKNTITNENHTLTSSVLCLYLVKDNLQNYKVLANLDGVLTDVLLNFETDPNTDGLFNISYTDNTNAITKTSLGYLITPTRPTIIKFTLSAINTQFVKTFSVVINNILATDIQFKQSVPTDIYIGDVINLAPTITPIYACADVVVSISNDDVLKWGEGNILALNLGAALVKINVNNITKTYTFNVVSNEVHIITQCNIVESGVDITYFVGFENNYASYNQEIQVLIYNKDEQIIYPDSITLEVFVSNNVVSVRTNLSKIYIQLKSLVYDVLSERVEYTI